MKLMTQCAASDRRGTTSYSKCVGQWVGVGAVRHYRISLVSCSLPTGSGIETIPHAMSAPVPAVTGGQSSGMMGTRALSARSRSEGPAAPLPRCGPGRARERRLELWRGCADSSCRENGGPPAGLQNAIPDRATCVSDTHNNGIDSMFTRTNSDAPAIEAPCPPGPTPSLARDEAAVFGLCLGGFQSQS